MSNLIHSLVLSLRETELKLMDLVPIHLVKESVPEEGGAGGK